MMDAIIIEDEAQVLVDLQRVLTQFIPEIRVIGTAQSVEEGVRVLRQSPCDVVFMDVELGDRLSFEIFKHLPKDHGLNIIFTTGHDKYALNAIKASAIDYLLKPVDPEELMEAVQRVKDRHQQENQQALFDTLLENTKDARSPRKLALRTQETLYVVEISDIIRCEAESNYTTFYLSGGRKILVSKTMREFEEPLLAQGFYRPHRSHLVNLSHLEAFDKKEGGRILLKENQEAPVSTRKKEEFLRLLDQLLG
ncbi:MAG TPA: DNA-binding response regulator [Cytophagales bacterium]|nr:DNA-binding response regulator [Cytophagales bacterium]HAA21641.1 DNA-binding response regulator [Cytophagales bacterium]HAP60432.1 DNA-binding response regulator [Cytophagales bacterium]